MRGALSMISFHSHSWNFLCLFFLLRCLVLKTNFWGGDAASNRACVSRREGSSQGYAVHPACGGLWFKLFFCHRPYRGALVKPLHVRLHGDCGVVVSNFVAFFLQVVKKTPNNVKPICLSHMREGSAWLGQLESKPSCLHFFYNFHTEVHQCCCLKSHLLQSLTTLNLTSQFRSTVHSPLPVSYHTIISYK